MILGGGGGGAQGIEAALEGPVSGVASPGSMASSTTGPTTSLNLPPSLLPSFLRYYLLPLSLSFFPTHSLTTLNLRPRFLPLVETIASTFSSSFFFFFFNKTSLFFCCYSFAATHAPSHGGESTVALRLWRWINTTTKLYPRISTLLCFLFFVHFLRSLSLFFSFFSCCLSLSFSLSLSLSPSYPDPSRPPQVSRALSRDAATNEELLVNPMLFNGGDFDHAKLRSNMDDLTTEMCWTFGKMANDR